MGGTPHNTKSNQTKINTKKIKSEVISVSLSKGKSENVGVIIIIHVI